jgi:hypothetical protein
LAAEIKCQPTGCTPPRPENRPGDAGEPGTPLDDKKTELYHMSKRIKRDRWLVTLGVILIFLFLSFFLFKIYIPSDREGWSTIPVIDYIFIVAFLICFIGIEIGYSYRSWTKNANEYMEWFIAQQIFGGKLTRHWIGFVSKEYYLWVARIFSPLSIGVSLIILVFITVRMIAGKLPP